MYFEFSELLNEYILRIAWYQSELPRLISTFKVDDWCCDFEPCLVLSCCNVFVASIFIDQLWWPHTLSISQRVSSDLTWLKVGKELEMIFLSCLTSVPVDSLCVKPTGNGYKNCNINHHGKGKEDIILNPTTMNKTEEWTF